MRRYRLTRLDTGEAQEFELPAGPAEGYARALAVLRFTAGNIPCYTGPLFSSRQKLAAAMSAGEGLRLPNWELEVLS